MKKLFLMILFFAVLPITMLAQTPDMMAMARAELQKRGLEETEVRARLLQEGIDVDNIPPTEYANYQSRVMEVLNKMQKEKAAAKAAQTDATPAASANAAPTTSVMTAEGTEIIAEAAAAAETPKDIPQTTMGEAAAEEALENTLEENHVSKTAGDDIYGHSLFTGTSMDVFRTTDGAQAPDTYVLGYGDEIHVSIFGKSQTEIHQRIGPDGSIQPAGLSKIFLKGMTLGQARDAIVNKLSSHYSFGRDQIAVTITTARTISVSIYGEVGVQGGFTLSALNTAFNALAAAGGPTAIGSVRNIQRSRSGKTDRLDLYQYMQGNTKNVHYDLQNGDVLFVPVANTIVTIEGAVRRPMRYEMIEGESLRDLVEYAGGLTYNAYPDFIQVERRVNDEIKYLEYNLEEIMSGNETVVLKGGDVIRIKSSNRPMENFVSINGDVYYGGNFDYETNHSLLGLIEKAQPQYTARRDNVIVERTSPDETVEVITVPFPGENGNPDFKLEPRDKVTVLAQDAYLEKWTISVNGSVRNPFSRTFGLNDQMTLKQALDYAGGPTYSARTDFVYVERTRPDQTVEVITVPFPGIDGNPDFQLQARDVVTVLSLTSFRDVEEISVSGQVRNPFTKTFGLNDRMTVSQAIEYAHGLKPSNFPVAYIFRKDITNPEKMTYIRVNLDTEGDDVELQPGDRLRVYDNTRYTNVGEVRISGAVKEPFGTAYDASLNIHDLIWMAGGFTVGAAYDRVEVFRLNISKTNEVDLELITLQVDDDYNLIGNEGFQLQPYDHVVVRMTPNYSTGRYVEVNGRVKYPGVYVLEDNKTQLWDVIKRAGGLLDDADPYARLMRTEGRNTGNIGINLKKVKKNRRSIKNDPILMDGDVINIVRQENTVMIRETGTYMSQYVPAGFSSEHKLLVYDGRHSAKWYVKHYAGGFLKTTDKKSVTVTFPNGQTEGTSQFIFRHYPKVEPGGVITMRIDTKKKERIEKPKEKIDWGYELRNSLAALTSVVSIILLVENIK